MNTIFTIIHILIILLIISRQNQSSTKFRDELIFMVENYITDHTVLPKFICDI